MDHRSRRFDYCMIDMEHGAFNLVVVVVVVPSQGMESIL